MTFWTSLVGSMGALIGLSLLLVAIVIRHAYNYGRRNIELRVLHILAQSKEASASPVYQELFGTKAAKPIRL